MLPVAKFAWERLEFILAPHQDREKQQQVTPAAHTWNGNLPQLDSLHQLRGKLRSKLQALRPEVMLAM